MNRNEEYRELVQKLEETAPELQNSFQKAGRRKARRQFIYQPVMGLAAVSMMFVLAVNLCAPVANACSNIPIIKQLAKAVTFSKSLVDAVENGYLQEVGLKQTKGGVTVEITDMVVDHEMLMVFYRFESEEYESLEANCTMLDQSGQNQLGIIAYESGNNLSNEEIRCVTSEYVTINVSASAELEAMPGQVQFHMEVWDNGSYLNQLYAGAGGEENYVLDREKAAERYYITSFDFQLELDLARMAEAVHYEVNQEIEMDGRRLTVTNIDVYPTYMRVNVEDNTGNTAELKDLHFYVENGDGERFYNFLGTSYIIAQASEVPVLISFDTESPYFADSESLKLVVTGGEWLEPGQERTRINLRTGETSGLPENVTLKEIQEKNGMLYLRFEQQCEIMSDERIGTEIIRKLATDPFSWKYYDTEGKEYTAEWTGILEASQGDGTSGVHRYECCLGNYPYEEVRMENLYSALWTAEEEMSIIIR